VTTPGSTISLRGTLDIDGAEIAITPAIDYLVAFDRVVIAQPVVRAESTPSAVTVEFDVVQERDRIRMTPRSQIVPPYRLEWSLDMTALWKDPLPFDVQTLVRATQCTDSALAQSRVQLGNCAAAYRMVRLGLPTVTSVEIRPMPVREHISVILETSADIAVSVDLIDLSGAVIVRWEKIDLKKGLSHCNFNCSMIADGTYRLRVGQGIEHMTLPLVIVN
jgi:hypothetical protein